MKASEKEQQIAPCGAKIRARLGMGPSLTIPITVKPKGTRWSMFEHLRAQERASAAITFAHAWGFIERMRASGFIDLGGTLK